MRPLDTGEEPAPYSHTGPESSPLSRERERARVRVFPSPTPNTHTPPKLAAFVHAE